jgi:hypothetical protein
LNEIEKFKGDGWGANKERKMMTKKVKLIVRRPGLSPYRTKLNFLEKDYSLDTVDGVGQKVPRQPKTGSFAG